MEAHSNAEEARTQNPYVDADSDSHAEAEAEAESRGGQTDETPRSHRDSSAKTGDDQPVDYAAFGKEIEAVRRKVHAKLGDEDIDYIRDVIKVSRAAEATGRGLLHFGRGPGSFVLGTGVLWLHKILEAMEIGHTVLHGAYNNLENNEGLTNDDFYWRVPIHEGAWKQGHNVKHHRHTNVHGKDPDMQFGFARLSDRVEWRPSNKIALPFTLLILFPNFGFWMNWHFTGVADFTIGKDQLDVFEEKNKENFKIAMKQLLSSYGKYYGYEYVLWPVLAGWRAPRVLAGNMISDMFRDIYAAATIFCGHIGEETADYAEDETARGRGQWYAMQVESANNFRVSKPVSILCGGLDLQIEHHLFPELAPNRLREIQPEIQEICERHGVEYRMDSWAKTLFGALKKIARLSKKDGGNPFKAASRVAGDMT